MGGDVLRPGSRLQHFCVGCMAALRLMNPAGCMAALCLMKARVVGCCRRHRVPAMHVHAMASRVHAMRIGLPPRRVWRVDAVTC
jgi:hypothetical protein